VPALGVNKPVTLTSRLEDLTSKVEALTARIEAFAVVTKGLIFVKKNNITIADIPFSSLYFKILIHSF